MTREQISEAVLAAYGVESATQIAKRLGITKGAVVGIWGRGRAAGKIGMMPRAQRISLWEKGRSRVLLDLTGAALAYTKADPDGARTCRWPIGDPREPEFRFCGEVVTTPTIKGANGHDRPNAYCDDCRARSLSPRTEKHRTAVLGHAAYSTPRQVKASALRFGRASA